MKKITLFILTTLLAISAQAQWTRTHISTTKSIGIADLCEHNGSLYSSVVDSGLVRYNETLTKWETVKVTFSLSGYYPGNIHSLASSGNNLYAYVNYAGCASTMIFKSTDGGSTFTADTMGHPRVTINFGGCKGYPLRVHKVFVLNGKLINVINGGFYSKYPADMAWEKTTDPKVTFGELFAEYNNKWYVWSDNYKLHTSADSGKNWTTPTNAGLPGMYNPGVMNINPASGRIYVAGNSLTTGEYRFLYSDDQGAKWDSLPINQYLGMSWLNAKQEIMGMVSKGDNLTIMLENDANNSHPDVMKSTDGGQTFVVDTVGLQADAFSTGGVSKMIYFKGKLWMAPSYHDIYTQGTATMGIKTINSVSAVVYPNPFAHSLYIKDDFNIDAVQVFDIVGNLILSTTPNQLSHTVNLSTVANGIYFVNVISNNQNQSFKVIKQ